MSDKGILESAADKTKEMAGNVKETVSNAYDKVTGNDKTENKMANKMKEGADTCAKKATEARDSTAEKMRDAARSIEGH